MLPNDFLSVFAQILKAGNKKKFRQEHQTELGLYESTAK